MYRPKYVEKTSEGIFLVMKTPIRKLKSRPDTDKRKNMTSSPLNPAINGRAISTENQSMFKNRRETTTITLIDNNKKVEGLTNPITIGTNILVMNPKFISTHSCHRSQNSGRKGLTMRTISKRLKRLTRKRTS